MASSLSRKSCNHKQALLPTVVSCAGLQLNQSLKRETYQIELCTLRNINTRTEDACSQVLVCLYAEQQSD